MIAALALSLALQGTVTSETAIAKMREAFQGHKSVQGTFRFRSYEQTGDGKFAFMAPNYLMLQTGNVRVVSDGNRAFRFFDAEKYYVELDSAAREAVKFDGFTLILENTLPPRPNGEAKPEKVGTEDAVAVPVASPSAPDDLQATIVISTRTWLPLILRASRSGKLTEEATFENVTLDAPLKPEDFSVAIPDGYQNLNGSTPTTTPTNPPVTTPPITAPPKADPKPTPPKAPVKAYETAFRRLPGQVADAAPGALKVSKNIVNATLGKKAQWMFTVQTQSFDAYDWEKAVVQARVPGGWRKAVYVGRSKEGILYAVERKESLPPDALSLTLRPTSDQYPTPIRFGYDWKPLRGKG